MALALVQCARASVSVKGGVLPEGVPDSRSGKGRRRWATGSEEEAGGQPARVAVQAA